MASRDLAVIVCNNGLGHLKRVLAVLRRLYAETGFPGRTSVFVDCSKLASFPREKSDIDRERWPIVFENVEGVGADFEAGFLARHASALASSAWVWSDNLAFPLARRPDTVLTGSFLWFEETRDPREEELVRKRSPLMIGSRLFATPGARSAARFEGVDLYEYLPPAAPGESRGILIACGRSGRVSLGLHAPALQRLLSGAGGPIPVFVDPGSRGGLDGMAGVRAADWSAAMYRSVAAAAIRPGLGTVCDVLSHQGRVFAFSEKGCSETAHNAAVLEDLGVGERCSDVSDAVARGLRFLRSPGETSRHRALARDLAFGGLGQTARRLAGIFR